MADGQETQDAPEGERVQGVADMTPAQRAEALAALAREGDVRVRKSVAIALGGLADACATHPLLELLGDEDEGVRVLACQALGRVADPSAVPALLARVHDASVEVRSGVLFALASVAAHGGLSDEARAELFTPMVVMAFDPDDGVRADAAATLGTLHDARSCEPLSLLAQDACAQVRANACASLGLTDEPAGLAVLLERACDEGEDPLVRVAALDGLARRSERGLLAEGTPEAANAVALACTLAEGAPAAAAARVADEGVADAGSGEGEANPAAERPASAADLAATAVWALGMLVPGEARPRVQAALAGALACEDAWIERYAVEALARIGDDDARAELGRLAAARATGARELAPEVSAVLDRALELLE